MQYIVIVNFKFTLSIVTRNRQSGNTGRSGRSLRIYAENQALLQPILLYQASKCKQSSEECLWTHIFSFL